MITLKGTDITVSRLCLGALTMGPLQRALPVRVGADIICRAIDLGINFVDTAQYYRTYEYIRPAVEYKRDIVVCTKTYAYTAQMARDALDEALAGIGRDYIDIFMLHEQESEHTLRGHYEALCELKRLRDAGYIRALGISTHNIGCMTAALKYPEIQVVQAIFNYRGLGIHDGARQDMEAACDKLHGRGVSILAMKPLGGGALLHEREQAFEYIIDNPRVDCVAMGMQSIAEVEYNCARFAGRDVSAIAPLVDAQPRKVHVQDWCEGCGSCVTRCKNGGIELKNGKATVIKEKCVVCGYCVGVCPQLALKII